MGKPRPVEWQVLAQSHELVTTKARTRDRVSRKTGDQASPGLQNLQCKDCSQGGPAPWILLSPTALAPVVVLLCLWQSSEKGGVSDTFRPGLSRRVSGTTTE